MAVAKFHDLGCCDCGGFDGGCRNDGDGGCGVADDGGRNGNDCDCGCGRHFDRH